MSYGFQRPSRRNGRLALLASVAGLAVFASGSPVVAQDDADEDLGEIEQIFVTGIRGSLQQSLDVKRDARQIVDAVSAEDVGKFPDSNVAEALQRITGVSIDRSGGEGQFITVRGLGPEFNAVLLNGRTIATDNDGREFSFDVLSSDIIQRAEVYKSATPNLQSGGIGSVVNIVTARPLDRPGTSFTASAAGLYDTLRDKFSPEITGVASWTNDDDTVGFLLGASYSNRKSQEDSSFTNGFALRDGAVNAGDIAVNAPESSTGLDPSAIGPIPTSRVQQQVVHSRDVQDRERLTISGAAQWRPMDNLLFTVDGLYSRFDVESLATQFSGFFSPPFINPVIDENGTVVSFSRPSVDFQNRNPLIADVVGLSQNDNVITANNRLAETYVIGGNVEYDLNESVSVELDVSKSRATRDGTNPFVVIGALAPESPLIEIPNDNGISTITNLVGLTDRSIQRLHFVNVARDEVEDDIFEASLGVDWDVNRGPLAVVSVGGLYTDRSKEQQVFDNFSPTQGGNIFCAYCGYNVAPPDTSFLTEFSFEGFLSGVPGAETVAPQILAFTFEDAFRVLNDTVNITNPARQPGLTPEEFAANAADLIARRDAAGDSIFGFYTPDLNPGASFAVDEQIFAVYLNTEWEGDFGDLPWSANVGFRVAITETTSTGVDQPVIEFRESPGDTQLLIMFGPSTPVSVDNRYVNFMPSVNFRVDPTDNTVLRLSYTETVTRPTLTALGVNNTFGGRSNAPVSGGGNPFLEAFESENYDVSFEWYFDDVGFFGIAGFHKEFSNFLESQTLPVIRPIVFPAGNVSNPTDMDVTRDVAFQDTRDRNGESGSITGVEVAFQMVFDSLPSPWDGLGTQINYTYVTSSIDRAEGSGAADCDYNGLSPHSFNISGFYEKDRIQARIAYNYRDEFLFQCFSNFSEPRQREAFGQVDFSAAFDVNDWIQIFAEGVNILGADTRDFSRFPNRFLTYSNTGSRYLIGVRGSF